MKLQAEKSSKFTRKYQCQSLVFNKVAGWIHSVKIKSLIHLCFFCTVCKKTQVLCTILRSVLLLITGKCANCLHSSNIVSFVGSCCDCLQTIFFLSLIIYFLLTTNKYIIIFMFLC